MQNQWHSKKKSLLPLSFLGRIVEGNGKWKMENFKMGFRLAARFSPLNSAVERGDKA